MQRRGVAGGAGAGGSRRCTPKNAKSALEFLSDFRLAILREVHLVGTSLETAADALGVDFTDPRYRVVYTGRYSNCDAVLYLLPRHSTVLRQGREPVAAR